MKIAVLAGGTSTERDVSLITGKMVYKAEGEWTSGCTCGRIYGISGRRLQDTVYIGY